MKIDIENNRLVTNYMETRGCVGEYDAKSKSSILTVSSQGVHGLRDTLAGIMKTKAEKIRVITGDVGGGVRDEDLHVPGIPALGGSRAGC